MVLGITSLWSFSSFAADVDAGDYNSLPPGSNIFALTVLNNKAKGFYQNGEKTLDNAEFESQISVLRFVHFTQFGKYTIDPQFMVPIGSLKAKGDMSALGDTDGMGDLILANAIWLKNDTQNNKYFAITPMLTVPTGSYDADRPLNMGENRWKLTIQAGYTQPIMPKVTWDVVGDVTFYGKNDEYSSSRLEMEQDESYQLQSFLRYNVTPTFDFRVGASQTWGGETNINGVDQGDRTQVTKWSIGASWLALPSVSLLANYGKQTSVYSGFKEENQFNMRLVKVF